jgi:hypothetical protein
MCLCSCVKHIYDLSAHATILLINRSVTQTVVYYVLYGLERFLYCVIDKSL